jgi:hypothetical protein
MTIWRRRIACWITEATSTHLYCEILTAFPRNKGYTNASQHYVTRTLPDFLLLILPNFLTELRVRSTCMQRICDNRVSFKDGFGLVQSVETVVGDTV